MTTRLKTNRKTNTRLKTTRKQQRRRQRRSRGERPTIRFTPYAWSKLLFLRDCGDTEVGGFGIHATNDLLLVEDVRLVTQQCTTASVQFTDAAVQEVLDEQSGVVRTANNIGRIWIHTHPGDCARPSDADEETFARCCSAVDWAVMFIIASCGDTYARLQFNIGPRCSRRLRVDVDYTEEFQQTDFAGWKLEYDARVQVLDLLKSAVDRRGRLRRGFDSHFGDGLQDAQVRAAVSSEWLAHCDAVPLFEDEVEDVK
jgi:proteasome lid subunit RPN8/RPN11